MDTIIFVCTGNTCRSSMAQAIAEHKKKKRGIDVEFLSAGLAAWEGAPASSQALQALKEMGIDLSHHRARRLNGEMVAQARLLLTMTRSQKERLLALYPWAREKVFTLKEYIGKEGDIPDPFGQDVEAYRRLAQELSSLIEEFLDRYQESRGLTF